MQNALLCLKTEYSKIEQSRASARLYYSVGADEGVGEIVGVGVGVFVSFLLDGSLHVGIQGQEQWHAWHPSPSSGNPISILHQNIFDDLQGCLVIGLKEVFHVTFF